MKLPRAKLPARSDLNVLLLRSYYRERMIHYLQQRLPRIANLGSASYPEIEKIVDHLLEILDEAQSQIGRSVSDTSVGDRHIVGSLHSDSTRPRTRVR